MAVKILMADPDRAVLELAMSTMSSLKWCDLVTVTDGHKAVEHLQRQKFDGLVMADRIPGTDALDLIRQVKGSTLNASVPIVMLTGEIDLDTMRKGFNAGVTFFAAKPPNRERCYHLFNAVRGAMETEKRRHHRLPYRTPVTCAFGDVERNRFVGESVEISEGGMSVRPSGGVAVGQILELEFLMPQISKPAHPVQKPRKGLFAEHEEPATGPQRVRAIVRFATPEGGVIGLGFLDLKPPQREAIQLYIAGSI
jgi:two-component system chemotaxis response regulator CheY